MKPRKNRIYRILFLDEKMPSSWYKGLAVCVSSKADAFMTSEDNGTPNYEFEIMTDDGLVKDTGCFFPEWSIVDDIGSLEEFAKNILKKKQAKKKAEMNITIGTVLVHSIGSGCDTFYAVVKLSPKSVLVRELDYQIVEQDIKNQTHKIKPVSKYADSKPIRLRLHDGQIGPSKRLMWWRVWDGKPRPQWSN